MNRAGFAGLGLALMLVSCGASRAQGERIIDLSRELTEVSGLAVAGPDSVFTHDDEFAIIYEIGLSQGRVLRAFALGEPTLEGDFEGIATSGGQVFLITSDGLIYAAMPGQNGKRVAYHVFDSGIGPRCEIEGLSEAPMPGSLLVLCKRFRNEGGEALLEIHRWKIGSDRAEPEPFLTVPLKVLLGKKDRVGFRPSGIEFEAATGRLYVVSGRNHTVLILNQTGELIERHQLKAGTHPQTEGITIMPDGRLVLADEGSRSRAGRISVYPNGWRSGPSGKP